MDALLKKGVNLTLEELIRYYHGVKPKLKYKDICTIINEHHEIDLTMRTLKEKLRKYCLTRVRNVSDNELRNMVSTELETSACSYGYRQMTEHLCIKFGINISKEAVRRVLKSLDPNGVSERRRHVIRRRVYDTDGPGHIYYIDGNDKLKRFGFAIHGCVDGFSRRILWLHVSTSNNDPVIYANYFLSAVATYHLCPKILRMDKGTENIYCEDLQTFLTGRDDSFIYAASTRNQRIESFWARLKRYKLSWWIDFFSTMVKDKIFCPHNEVHQEVLYFCFMPVLQGELNMFTKAWNSR